MNGVRLNISSEIGMPITVSWISQARPIQIAEAHQATRTNQRPRIGQATWGRPRSRPLPYPARPDRGSIREFAGAA